MASIKKCLFPVAGYGTRFLPATKAMPKEMLPIVNKPLIQYGVEEAFEAGLKEIAFVTGRGKRAIEDHFDVSYELERQIEGTDKEVALEEVRALIDGCTFSYTRQREIRGLGHAILTGETLIGNQAFGVILADDLCVNTGKGVLGQLVDAFALYKGERNIVAVEEVPESETHKYGIVAGALNANGHLEVSRMVEKPAAADAPSRLAIIGRYVLTSDIFDILRRTKAGRGGEIQITDALNEAATQGRVIATKFEGRRFDCGGIDGFVAATNFFFSSSATGTRHAV